MSMMPEYDPDAASDVVTGPCPADAGDHILRCSVLIGAEQEKPLPDNALIAALCDAVRFARETMRLRSCLFHIAHTCTADPDTAQFACRAIDGSASPPREPEGHIPGVVLHETSRPVVNGHAAFEGWSVFTGCDGEVAHLRGFFPNHDDAENFADAIDSGMDDTLVAPAIITENGIYSADDYTLDTHDKLRARVFGYEKKQ